MNDDDGSANLSAIDLNLLVMLDALLDERSVTHAAQRVGISQPAMSHALARLRRLFGDQLLVRAGGRFTLTPRAQRLRLPLAEALRRTEDLFAEGGFDPASDRREVVIAMTTSSARVLGRPLSGLLAQEAPHLRLRVLATMGLHDALFLQESIDVMLLSETHNTEFRRERLYEDEWVVVSGSSQLCPDNALEILESLPHVVYEPLLRLRPYQVLREAGIDWNVQILLSDTLATLEFLAHSPRVGVLRRQMLNAVEGDGLYVAPFPLDAGPLGLDMVWNPWLRDEAFQGWLRSSLRRASEKVVR